jgi:hypothetical protein
MYINEEKISKIVIQTTEKPVQYDLFENFIRKSPFVRQIAFIGKAIFDSPDVIKIIDLCRLKSIALIFGEMAENVPFEIVDAIVNSGIVIAVNLHDGDKNIDVLNELKTKYQMPIPEVNAIIKTPPRTPQDTLSATSYAFYNLADDKNNVPCWNLLNEPMIDYDGSLLGCWTNPDKKHPINAFDLGIQSALNKSPFLNMIKMLKTGKINVQCPCARCPVFASFIWSDSTIDVYSRTQE